MLEKYKKLKDIDDLFIDEILNEQVTRKEKYFADFGSYIHYATKEQQSIFYIKDDYLLSKLKNNEVVIRNNFNITKIFSKEDSFVYFGAEILLDYSPEYNLEELIQISFQNNELVIIVKEKEDLISLLEENKKFIGTFNNPFRETNIEVTFPNYLVFGVKDLHYSKEKFDYWKTLSPIDRMKYKGDN